MDDQTEIAPSFPIPIKANQIIEMSPQGVLTLPIIFFSISSLSRLVWFTSWNTWITIQLRLAIEPVNQDPIAENSDFGIAAMPSLLSEKRSLSLMNWIFPYQWALPVLSPKGSRLRWNGHQPTQPQPLPYFRLAFSHQLLVSCPFFPFSLPPSSPFPLAHLDSVHKRLRGVVCRTVVCGFVFLIPNTPVQLICALPRSSVPVKSIYVTGRVSPCVILVVSFSHLHPQPSTTPLLSDFYSVY